MKKHQICRCIVLAIISIYCAASIADRKPNIVLIVADDLGYADLGFQGVKDIPTPALDALAASGIRFTNGYVTGTWCSPSRAALMTGRYQQRFGDNGHEATPAYGLDLEETTLADRLRTAGYTTGLVGKWHLGEDPKFHPMQRGFDEFFGFLRGGHNFFPDVPIIIFPDRNGIGEDLGQITEARETLDRQILRDNELVAEKTYLTAAFSREAVSFIRRHEAKPFFLYLSFNAVHTPMQATADRLEKFASVNHPVRKVYNAMTLAVDEAVGDVLTQLSRSGLEEDTLIFFISDNGGPTLHRYAYNASNNSPLRGSKGTTLEAGIRVPFVISWPGQIASGEKYNEPVIQMDIFPTVLAAAGIDAESKKQLDGVNLLPYLHEETSASPHEALFWRSLGQMAIRRGNWKLVSYVAKMDEGELLRSDPRDEMTPLRLYDLKRDIGESQDLSKQEPQVAAELLSLWNQWNDRMTPAL